MTIKRKFKEKLGHVQKIIVWGYVILRDGPVENLWGGGGRGGGRSTKNIYSREGKLNEKKFMYAN